LERHDETPLMTENQNYQIKNQETKGTKKKLMRQNDQLRSIQPSYVKAFILDRNSA